MHKRILIIEDNRRMSRLLKMYLERERYQVDISGRGESGLFQALINRYDLIVLNLLVRGMNGMKVLEEIRINLSTPVFMLSSICGIYNETKCLEKGANEYILMPFSPREFVLKVKHLFASTHTPIQTEDGSISDDHPHNFFNELLYFSSIKERTLSYY